MNPQVEYEMSEEDLNELLDACRPTPCMYLSGGMSISSSPQENANAAWAKLGQKMGFDSMTVRPSNKGNRFFTAVPSETEAQKTAREKREAKEKKAQEIKTLKADIAEKQKRLDDLECVTS